jgi:hypothetical protein
MKRLIVTIIAATLLATIPALAEYALPHCERFKSHLDPNWHPPGWVDPKRMTDAQILQKIESQQGHGVDYDLVEEAVRRHIGGWEESPPQNPGYLRDVDERDQQRAAWECWQTLMQCADDTCRRVGFKACMAAKLWDCP